MLTGKQEKFVLNLFQGMSQREAYIKAGYSANFAPAIIDSNACRLAKSNKVLVRLTELNSKVENAAIMSVTERRERLSEIARGRLTDYQEAGADGSGYINIGKESPNTAAIAGIESATKFGKNGNTGTLFTKVKLHNPVNAIAELNKMDNLYNAPINIDNRQVTFRVIYGDISKSQTATPETTIIHEVESQTKDSQEREKVG
jgi:hypothetical protein